MSLLRLVIFALVLLPGALSPAQSGEPPAETQGKARIDLIIPQTSVRPGESVPVAVKFIMEPGWHIYWKNPGDAGQAPRFSWSLPGGGASRMMRGSEWTATEPSYPVPVRWEDAGGIVGNGYTGTVIFPAEIKVPASATPGQQVEVGVNSNYMVCKEICLVEWASASATLNVSAESAVDEEKRDPAAMQLIEQARQALPQPAREPHVKAKEGGAITVVVRLPSGVRNMAFFSNPPAGLVVEDLRTGNGPDGFKAEFRLRTLAGAKVDAKAFEAVVGYDTNEGRRGVSLQIPVQAGG